MLLPKKSKGNITVFFFYDDDHIELRDEFKRLIKIGTKVVLTNSNTPFVHKLYEGYLSEVFETKRLISSNATNRRGEDLVIYSINGKKKLDSKQELLENFPGTRYMGSKYKMLPFLWDTIKDLEFKSALDAFSGNGCVSYMLKQKGIKVYSNDFMEFSANITKSTVENSAIKIEQEDLDKLLEINTNTRNFISTTFKGLYFSDEDNRFLDCLIANINQIEDQYKKSLAFASIIRACHCCPLKSGRLKIK
ncbi:hypothetical protein EZS27_026099 [termite gut metagenome]|uniref:Site-specific DNA-methyltransferase (adenine-specific) n=1 Tax=termite gut metagenome TaxID=433724 RepID=A0A5J4QST5_9ZZZZ